MNQHGIRMIKKMAADLNIELELKECSITKCLLIVITNGVKEIIESYHNKIASYLSDTTRWLMVSLVH